MSLYEYQISTHQQEDAHTCCSHSIAYHTLQYCIMEAHSVITRLSDSELKNDSLHSVLQQTVIMTWKSVLDKHFARGVVKTQLKTVLLEGKTRLKLC